MHAHAAEVVAEARLHQRPRRRVQRPARRAQHLVHDRRDWVTRYLMSGRALQRLLWAARVTLSTAGALALEYAVPGGRDRSAQPGDLGSHDTTRLHPGEP